MDRSKNIQHGAGQCLGSGSGSGSASKLIGSWGRVFFLLDTDPIICIHTYTEGNACVTLYSWVWLSSKYLNPDVYISTFNLFNRHIYSITSMHPRKQYRVSQHRNLDVALVKISNKCN